MPSAVLANLIRFVELLRAAGVSVHAGRLTDAAIATEAVGVRRREDLRAGLRCLLVRRHEDITCFDEVFDRFWRVHGDVAVIPRLPQPGEPDASGDRPGGAAVQLIAAEAANEDGAGDGALQGGAWSAREALRTRDFATLTPEELVQAAALLARLPWRLGVRRTRRWVRGRAGSRIDLRSMLRANMKHGCELVEVPRRRRQHKPRPVVVLADVSGSMEPYARMLLQFVHGMSAGAHEVESFVFATRLTRITRDVARGGGAALSAAAGRIQDWGGGTRIGEALRAFNLHYARRVMRHGPVVLLISDGWDRGDPDQLARELARVRRSCRRLVWLNPLLGSASYEPLTRGMQAALPLIDDFLPAHNIDSLGRLAGHLRRLDRHAD